jgi:hypothetical protein
MLMPIKTEIGFINLLMEAGKQENRGGPFV